MMLLVHTTISNKSSEASPLPAPTTMEFTPAKLWQKLLEYNIEHPEIVYRQAVHETADFKSRVFREGNNLFGMKYPNKRETTAVGVHRKHAKYQSWIDSVIDMKLWQDYHKRFYKKYPTYYKFLEARYAEDRLYVQKLKRVKFTIPIQNEDESRSESQVADSTAQR